MFTFLCCCCWCRRLYRCFWPNLADFKEVPLLELFYCLDSAVSRLPNKYNHSAFTHTHTPWLFRMKRTTYTMPCGDIWAKMLSYRHLWSSKSTWRAQKTVSSSALFFNLFILCVYARVIVHVRKCFVPWIFVTSSLAVYIRLPCDLFCLVNAAQPSSTASQPTNRNRGMYNGITEKWLQ